MNTLPNTPQEHYPYKSAGRLLTAKAPVVYEDATVGDIEQMLLKGTKDFETINYIYVLDNIGRLKGAVSVKEVFRSDKNMRVASLMPPTLVSVRPHTHQERVALSALKHNIKAVPVVDKDDIFLGVVTNDSILRILHSEAVEDMLRMGGMHVAPHDDIFQTSLVVSLKHRLPWLVLGLFGGVFTAGIVSSFEGLLEKNLILAAFIPLIVYMADAVGTQMEAFIIRDLAINPTLRFAKYFLRQSAIVLILGFIVSVFLYAVSFFLYNDMNVSFVLAVSLFLAVLSSLVTGLIVPYVFGRFRLDPANASGPVATIIQDVLSIFIYFTMAGIVL